MFNVTVGVVVGQLSCADEEPGGADTSHHRGR